MIQKMIMGRRTSHGRGSLDAAKYFIRKSFKNKDLYKKNSKSENSGENSQDLGLRRFKKINKMQPNLVNKKIKTESGKNSEAANPFEDQKILKTKILHLKTFLSQKAPERKNPQHQIRH